MKTTTFATLAAAIIGTGASAIVKRQDPAATVDDTVVLNYALTLEHLENAFYKGALEKFDAKAFTDAGFPSWVRGRFEQVSSHEQAHVEFLSAALGTDATQPCKYSFPYTDPKSFAALSSALEGVGVSAYIGAAQFITSKAYLTAAASVLSTEARHASWVQGAVNQNQPWSGALDIPLSFNQVYSLAAAFITSCPDSNPALPVKAFPTLQLAGNAGETVAVVYNATGNASDNTYVSFFTGLSQIAAPIKDGKVTIPAELKGTSYAFVTSSNGNATDDTILAGPAIVVVNFSSYSK